MIASVIIESARTKTDKDAGPLAKSKKYTAYVITVATQGGLKWMVHRRYSEVHTLDWCGLSPPCSANLQC